MIIGVDLGYGYVKTVNNNQVGNKIKFPSVVAPGQSGMFDDDINFGGSLGYQVQLQSKDNFKRNYLYVGDLAVRSRGATMTLSRDKFHKDMSVSLAMTAAYLAGGEGNITLAVGLPLAYYKQQKELAKKSLEGLSAFVKVGEGVERNITFKDVFVFPQGVGALFQYNKLPASGLIGIVDIGHHTTDYLLADIRQDGANPLPSFTSSTEVGMHTALKIFATEYNNKTGTPLDIIGAQRLWDKDAQTVGLKKKVNLVELKAKARGEAGNAIADFVLNAWSEQLDFIDLVITAGGGALEFNHIFNEKFGNVSIVDDPQFANCLGFVKLAEIKQRSRKLAKAKGSFTN